MGEGKRFIVPPIDLSTKNFVKIGLVQSEIFGGICKFFPIVPKVTSSTLVISKVTRPRVTKFIYNIQKSVAFDILKPEL